MKEGDWPRLGRKVRERREFLGLSVADCTANRSITDTTWTKLESGLPILPAKVRQVPDAILWMPESVELVLAGGDPIEIEGAPAIDRDAWLRKEFAEIRSEIRSLARLVEDRVPGDDQGRQEERA